MGSVFAAYHDEQKTERGSENEGEGLRGKKKKQPSDLSNGNAPPLLPLLLFSSPSCELWSTPELSEH